MPSYRTFSADGHAARWASADRDQTDTESTGDQSTADQSAVGPWREEIELRWDNEAWTATGQLAHEQATYVVRLSPSFDVRQILLFRDLDEPDLWLGTDGRGRWGEVNGSHRPDLDGTTDVRVGDSIFAFGSTIRRLDLPVGGAATVAVAEIDPETLGVVVGRRVFRRVDEHRWQVEPILSDASRDSDEGGQLDSASKPVAGFAIEFDVDDFGLPRDLAGIVRQH